MPDLCNPQLTIDYFQDLTLRNRYTQLTCLSWISGNDWSFVMAPFYWTRDKEQGSTSS